MVLNDAVIHGADKCVIMTESGGEENCYEISAEYNGLGYRLYISAFSGKEIDIFRVIDRPYGLEAV
jgi:ribosomal protein L30E